MTAAQSLPIVVRRAEPGDADAIATTFAMPGAMAGTLQLPYPAAATYAKWIDDVASGDYRLVAEIDRRVVGNLGLHAAGKSSRATSARWAFPFTTIASTAASAARYCPPRSTSPTTGSATRVSLPVCTDNDAAVALYRNAGFAIEGTARCCALRSGEYVDAHMMARITAEPVGRSPENT